MAVFYNPGFDLRDVGTFSITIDVTGQGTPTVYTEADFSTPLVSHTDSEASGLTYADLKGEFNTAVAAEPVSALYTNGLGYFFTSAQNFDITFSQAAADIFGVTTLVHTNITTLSSDKDPFYYLQGQQSGRSNYSRDYEPDGIASIAISDDGTKIHGLSRTASPKFLDWRQQFETLAGTFKSAASSSTPWTWEHFFEHCRTVHPFLIHDAYDNAWCTLRAEGSQFRPERQTPDFDDQWHIPIQAVLNARHV